MRSYVYRELHRVEGVTTAVGVIIMILQSGDMATWTYRMLSCVAIAKYEIFGELQTTF